MPQSEGVIIGGQSLRFLVERRQGHDNPGDGKDRSCSSDSILIHHKSCLLFEVIWIFLILIRIIQIGLMLVEAG